MLTQTTLAKLSLPGATDATAASKSRESTVINITGWTDLVSHERVVPTSAVWLETIAVNTLTGNMLRDSDSAPPTNASKLVSTG